MDNKIQAPFIPSATDDNFDLKHVNNNDWKDQDVVKENSLLLRRDSVQNLFKGYHYDKFHTQLATPSTKQNTIQVDSISKSKEIDEKDLDGEENVEDGDEKPLQG